MSAERDPPRLLDPSSGDLPPGARAVLRTVLDDDPSPVELARLAARLDVALAAPTGSVTSIGLTAAGKMVVGLLVVVAGGGAWWMLRTRPGVAPPPPVMARAVVVRGIPSGDASVVVVVARPAPAGAAAVAPAALATHVAPRAALATHTAPRTAPPGPRHAATAYVPPAAPAVPTGAAAPTTPGPSAPTTPVASSSTPSLAVSAPTTPSPGAVGRNETEEDLLGRAYAALRRGAAGEALELTEAHAARYATSTMDEDRERIAIEALARLGRTDAARERAARFHARHPRSPLRARITALVGGDAGP